MLTKSILQIASALSAMYKEVFLEESGDVNDLTQMKMHKMLYFAQKKHYENFGEWLFEEEFEGWVHGPVNTDVRRYFQYLHDGNYEELNLREEFTLREIVHDYGIYTAMVLKKMSHDESCYKKSRKGLGEWDSGNVTIKKEDIIDDIVSEEDHWHMSEVH